MSSRVGAKARPRGHKAQFIQLVDELNRARINVERNPLTSRQVSRLKQSMDHHAGRQVYKEDRYQPLVERIRSRHTKSGQLKLAAILERIEKANDEPYDTGDRSYRRVNNNAKCLDRNGNRFKCVSHAGAVVGDVLTAKDRKSDTRQYSTLPRIQQRIRGTDPGADYDKLKLTTTSRDIKENRELGNLLADHFIDMKPARRGGDCVRVGFLEVGDHSVPIRLKRSKVRGRERHVVTVGDFNRSNGNRRLQKNGADEFRGYELGDFLTPHRLYADLLDDQNGASMLLLHEPDEKRGHSSDSTTLKFRTTIDAPLTPQTVSYILDANFDFDPDEASKAISNASTKELEQILLAGIENHGGGMVVALKNGSAIAIDAYAKLFLSILDHPRHSSLQSKAASLLSSAWQGVNGVYFAMSKGSDEAIAAYGDLAKAAYARGYIDGTQFHDLLTWDDSVAPSPLYMAASNGHSDCIDAYLDVIGCLPEAQRLSLLALNEKGGKCGIASALSNKAPSLAGNLFAVHGRAYESNVISLAQLAVLAADPKLEKAVLGKTAGPDGLKAYKGHLAKVCQLIDKCEHKGAKLSALERTLKLKLALR